MSKINRPEATCNAPPSAFKEYRAFDSSLGDELPHTDHDYSSYRRLGNVPFADDSAHALRLARQKFGPTARVFAVARGYVAYEA